MDVTTLGRALFWSALEQRVDYSRADIMDRGVFRYCGMVADIGWCGGNVESVRLFLDGETVEIIHVAAGASSYYRFRGKPSDNALVEIALRME